MKRLVLVLGFVVALASVGGCIILDDEKETTFISPFGIDTHRKHPCRRTHLSHWCHRHNAWDECCDCRRPA